MNFLEKDLEHIIFEADNEDLKNKGLYIRGFKRRQFRIGNYGTCDLVAFKFVRNQNNERVLLIQVFELKKDVLTPDSFWQILRYWKGIKEYLTNHREVSFEFHVELKLVGKGVDINHESFCYLPAFIPALKLTMYSYTYTIDGLEFEQYTPYYKLINSGF